MQAVEVQIYWTLLDIIIFDLGYSDCRYLNFFVRTKKEIMTLMKVCRLE